MIKFVDVKNLVLLGVEIGKFVVRQVRASREAEYRAQPLPEAGVQRQLDAARKAGPRK